VQLFYRRTRKEEELGATQRREAQPGQGLGKGTASPARRGSAIGNRRPRGACELAGAGYGVGQILGSTRVRRLVWACWGSRPGVACWGKHRWPGGRRPLPLDGTGRGERRERRVGIQNKFTQNFKQKLEKL
jgi:hypothetical protein